jgi:hypothetical protein
MSSIDYEQKMYKYKQKYLNLKNNIMKGGVRMEIILTKNEDGSINIQLPQNFSSAASGTYRFEYDSESVASRGSLVQVPDTSFRGSLVQVPDTSFRGSLVQVPDTSFRGSLVQVPEIKKVNSSVELSDFNYAKLFSKINHYIEIFTNNQIDKIKSDNNLLKIMQNETTRNIFIYLMRAIFQHVSKANSFLMMSLQVRTFQEFLFERYSGTYTWIEQNNRWEPYQIELNKILNDPLKNKEIIDSFKIIFNELASFCAATN